GVGWEERRKGMAELSDVSAAAIRACSRRRAQVVEAARDGGYYAAQLAAHETRERKEHVDLTGLREDWRARAAEHGLGQREMQALLGRAHVQEPSREALLQLADRMLGPGG